MITSIITKKSATKGLYPSDNKWVELVFLSMYGHFAIQTISDKIVETCTQIG